MIDVNTAAAAAAAVQKNMAFCEHAYIPTHLSCDTVLVTFNLLQCGSLTTIAVAEYCFSNVLTN